MEEEFYQSNCGEDDVLSFETAMFKVDKLRKEVEALFKKPKLGQELSSSFNSQTIRIDVPGKHYEKWLSDGINCEILKIGAKGWQKGKVRIKLNIGLEFCPDEPVIEETQLISKPEINQSESSLDDIRQMMKDDSQQHNS